MPRVSQRSPFDRQAACPSCGAPMTFRFAGAAAQVCKHCKFVVVRSDRNLAAVGRVADLVDIPSPLTLETTGRWGNEPFMVDGRVQLDRAGAPGAPWQEFFITFPQSGRWSWVASAQGRWYATTEAPLPPGGLPPLSALRPGGSVNLGPHGTWSVAETGRRRVVSAEGELPFVAAPGVATPFADIAGPNGAFGTIDYGDGQAIPPKLYLGRQIDPAVMQLDSGAPIEAAQAKVQSVSCPSCGGNLPLVAPETAERIVCRYCGMASDFKSGALQALRPAPRLNVQPVIPLGQEGYLRGNRVICIAFLVRGCTVDGERYRWREYLIYAGPRVGYLWLMEEDGSWKYITPIAPGDVQQLGGSVRFRGRTYHQKQANFAEVEQVVGELYWRVEVGEQVRAVEYSGPGGIVSVETAPTEVTVSFCEPMSWGEISKSFALPQNAGPPRMPSFGGSGSDAPQGASCGTIIFVVIILVVLVIALGFCGVGSGGGGSIGGPSFGGPSFGGGK
ncbi:MAG: DUF4178 domain-containing protein [Polyangiaceae bacterium]|nr:DUF4178 domain-containing protein [Polyangiaceae bacterium]